MRFYTVEIGGEPVVAVSVDKGKNLFRLEDLGYNYFDMNDVIEDLSAEEIAELPQRIQGKEPLAEKSYTIMSPIPQPRQDVICLGINYDEHAKEAGSFSEEAFGGERPYTIYFSKRVTYSTGTGDVIPAYEGLVDSLDYEAELAVILKDDIRGVKAEEAAEHIFGYTIINDVSARNLQTRHKQWYLGKSLDGFTPMGPCIVTPDEIGDVANLKISSRVNGELRQNSNTKYMIQTVGGAIAELSAGMTLAAGTIIATGTPAGVGMGFKPPKFLQPGDVVVCEIENIGCLENKVEK